MPQPNSKRAVIFTWPEARSIACGEGSSLIFKPLSRDEYDRLTLQERVAYLERLQDDIKQKLADGRIQLEQTRKLIRNS